MGVVSGVVGAALGLVGGWLLQRRLEWLDTRQMRAETHAAHVAADQKLNQVLANQEEQRRLQEEQRRDHANVAQIVAGHGMWIASHDRHHDREDKA